MSVLLAAASWPDAVVSVASVAAVCFLAWVFFRD